MSSSNFRKFTSACLISSLKATQWMIARLPKVFVAICARGMFAFAYLFLGRLRRICLKNLQAVYGNTKTLPELEAMTKSCIKNIGYSMVDMLYYVDRPKELLSLTTIHHEDRLQEALQEGKGVVMITAHFGNFPLMFETLVKKGYKVNVVIRPMRDPEFGKFMHNECAKWNIKMLELEPPKTFIRAALNALRHNELLFILLDEVAPVGGGVTVDFFNHQVDRAVGPMLFHERAGSPILPMFIVKANGEKFDVFIEEALTIDSVEELKEVKAISYLTKVIEKYVKMYPLQWGGWLNKRWN